MVRQLLSLFLTLLLTIPAHAQDENKIDISIFTTAQGNDIYELEGHAAMRIRKGSGFDYTINWGLFDFNSPNFVYRFVKGETDYRCGAVPTEYFFKSYEREGRTIFEHHINVNDEVALKIYNLVSQNLTPPNDVYRYNYVRDNCATRPMEIIEKAIGQKIEYEDVDPKLDTFRKIMSFYHRNYPWYQFGIDIALGSGIDSRITAHDKVFAPVLLTKLLDTATYSTSGTKTKISDKKTIYGDENADITEAPTPWYLSPIFISLIFFIITLRITIRDIKRKKYSKWFDTTIYIPLTLGGLLLTFLIFISTHEATSPNYNYLWINPIGIIIASCIWIKKAKLLAISAIMINFVALIAYVAVTFMDIQAANPAFYPIIAAILLRNYTYLTFAKWQKVNNI